MPKYIYTLSMVLFFRSYSAYQNFKYYKIRIYMHKNNYLAIKLLYNINTTLFVILCYNSHIKWQSEVLVDGY